MLGTRAAQAALRTAGLAANDIDLIIRATSTPDFVFPSTACLVQKALGVAGGAAYDVQAVCSGFVYAMAVADSMIRSGLASRALVIGAEVFSRILDWNDRTTCVLFGDGAGAVVLVADDRPGILASRLHADGRHEHILRTAGSVCGGRVIGHPFLTMDGQAVFKLAVNGARLGGARDARRSRPVGCDDVDWLIPHQANVRILHPRPRGSSGLPLEQVVLTVDRSMPIRRRRRSRWRYRVGVDDGRIRAGQLVLMEGVGGGFTWAASLVRM